MDYRRIYNQIVESCLNRQVNASDVLKRKFERHHIVPRSMGGSDKVENLVLVTRREHYVLHQLLIKIHPEEVQMWFALSVLTNRYSKIPNNKIVLYSWIKVKLRSKQAVAMAKLWGQEGYKKKVLNGIRRTAGYTGFGRPSKLTPEKVEGIKEDYASGMAIRNIRKKHSVGVSTVYRVLNINLDSAYEPKHITRKIT